MVATKLTKRKRKVVSLEKKQRSNIIYNIQLFHEEQSICITHENVVIHVKNGWTNCQHFNHNSAIKC